jgi:hypothetical protein
MKFGQPTYVVKSWSIDRKAAPGQPIVQITGRSPGLLSWILSFMGIEPTVHFVLTDHNIQFAQGSLAGNTRRTIPLSQVSSISHGFVKPVWLIIVGILTLGFFGIGIIFIILYFLNKAISIGVGDTGGILSELRFKKSVIEGENIDESAAAHVASIIDELASNARTAGQGQGV